MLCEEGMIITEVRSALSIPQNTKQIVSTKTQDIRKIDKHYTNCGMTNHNLKTCRKKKVQTTVTTTKVAQPSQKPKKTFSYACHIYGLNGHKMIDCLKFVEMQKMFDGKFVVVVEVQLVVET